jgi:alpha-L-arabinofuranosidase
MGFNVIYPHEKNAIWQDGKIAGYLKDVNVAFIRYPGGTVSSYYHWNQLTGEGWKDSWDTANPVVTKSLSEFMGIDEYMALVKATGATPLVGINMSSGWRWNRNEDGINEAIALMQYCKDRNFKVEYWFLDNEPYQDDSNGGAKTPEQYGSLINTYVPVMKAFDPTIKIVVNWNSGFKSKRNEFEKLINLAGANIDVLDAHWYWSWSDTSWEKWLNKTPMTQWTGETYEGDIQYGKQMVKDLG